MERRGSWVLCRDERLHRRFARARPSEKVRVAGQARLAQWVLQARQAGPVGFAGPSGGHDVKLNAPARAQLHQFGAIFYRKFAETSLKVVGLDDTNSLNPTPCSVRLIIWFLERKLAFRVCGGIFSPCKSIGPQAHRPSQVG